jgi:NADH:ubiquinone oxidoreductase subunit 2 (subunit N)
LPPFAGFIGKFFLFSAVIKQGGAFAVLAVVAALNSVVSLYYYAKIVKTMFLDSPNPEDKTISVAVNDFTLLLPLACADSGVWNLLRAVSSIHQSIAPLLREIVSLFQY